MIDAILLLPKILARAGGNADLTETAAKIAWRRVAGEGLREHAVPMRLHDGSLVVSVADAVWQKQLQTMSAEMIFRVNKVLGQKVIDRIEFRIDPGSLSRGKRGPSSATSRSAAPLPPSVVSSAAEIQDTELRERFMRAAENCISRRENLGTGKSAIRTSQFKI